MLDPMQIVFDGSEAVQDALHNQEGIELALRGVLGPILKGQDEHVVWALVESMARFRCEAAEQVKQLQAVTFGDAH